MAELGFALKEVLKPLLFMDIQSTSTVAVYCCACTCNSVKRKEKKQEGLHKKNKKTKSEEEEEKKGYSGQVFHCLNVTISWGSQLWSKKIKKTKKQSNTFGFCRQSPASKHPHSRGERLCMSLHANNLLSDVFRVWKTDGVHQSIVYFLLIVH